MSVVPFSPADIGGLSLREAWDLEDQFADWRDLLSARIDAEIRRLAGEDWTQVRIAEECGRTQQAISLRMARLGIEPANNRGRPRITSACNSVPEAEPEIVDAVVVDGAPRIRTPDAAPVSRYLPEVLSDGPVLRDEVIKLHTQAARIADLLDAGAKLALSPLEGDRESLLSAVADIIKAAQRIKRRLG